MLKREQAFRAMQRRTFMTKMAQYSLLGLFGGSPLLRLLTAGETAHAAPHNASPNTPRNTSRAEMEYSRLGRTDLKISNVSFGASNLSAGQEDLVHHALEKGINYFDTADSYRAGDSERVIGAAIRGRRDKVVIASKGHAYANDKWSNIMQMLEGSLRRLDTDYVDVYFNHAVNDIQRLQNAEWGEFVQRATAQGKLRFTGMSGHAGHLVDSLNHALSQDMVDVILVAYNFGEDPQFYEKFTRSFDYVARQPGLPEVLDRAEQLDVGIVAMKMERGAKLNDVSAHRIAGATPTQTSIRWALSDPRVDAVLYSMTSKAVIDECTEAIRA